MTALLAGAGWVVAVGSLIVMRSRLELVAHAEHELRGPVTVIGLACERLRRDLRARPHAEALESELERLRAGLADLAAARRGRRAPARAEPLRLDRVVSGSLAGWSPALGRNRQRTQLDWRAGPATVVADRGRLAQALGNLLANAAEHGAGPVELRGRRVPGAVRVEVRNRAGRGFDSAADGGAPPARRARAGRGRGLKIATRAAESAGGRLELAAEDGEVVAALELPLAEREGEAAETLGSVEGAVAPELPSSRRTRRPNAA